MSEFFTAELATVLNVGRGTAAVRLTRALTWARKLPATFAALKVGELDERRAQALADALRSTPADVAARVEAALLGEASDLSVTGLAKRATELVLRFDADAAEEARAEAEKTADVHLYPSAVDGRAVLAADLPADVAAQAHDLIDQVARMLKADGDERPIGVLRTWVHAALILRPADHGLPLVAANLTITAALEALEGGAAPGEVNGLPITAAHLRDLLTRIGALGLTAPDGGSLSYAITGPDGQLLATVTPAELTRLARRGCTEHPDPAEAGRNGGGGGDGDGNGSEPCACPLLGPPPATTNYRPTERQRAFVTTRDRRCRFPSCGQRVGWADLDHVIPHACGGATDCANLCCLCRSHHRLKTFAPGWQFRMTPDGTLQVTTPSGVTRITRPPGLRPPGARPPEPAPPSAGSVTGPPPAEPGPPLTQDPPPLQVDTWRRRRADMPIS
ncbi:HNH endonuclease signature motif containing protein [Modestobacter sp. SYSU DS0875]